MYRLKDRVPCRGVGSTARYAHLARDAEKVAAAKVGDSIEADILRAERAVQRAEA